MTNTQQPPVVSPHRKRIDKGAVYGSCRLWFPDWKLRMHEVPWGHKPNGGQEWVLLPRRSWTDSQGNTRWSRFIDWADDRIRRQFQANALAEIHKLADGEKSDG